MNQENPFAKREREIAERDKRYGIDDLRGVDRAKVWYEGHTRIQEGNITDEEEKHKSLTTGVYGGNSMNVTVPQHEWRIIWRTCRVANPYSGGYSINSGGIIIVYLPQDTRQQKKEQQA